MRTATLGGVSVEVPISMSDEDVAAALIRYGQLPNAEAAFPREDINARVAEAQQAAVAEMSPFSRFAAGLQSKVADISLGIEDMLGVETERGAEIRQEQVQRAELEANNAGLGFAGGVGEIVPNLALGRLQRFFPVVGAESAIEGLAGQEGNRIESAAEGAIGATVGFGVGKLAAQAIDAGVSGARNLIGRVEGSRDAAANAPELIVNMADEVADSGSPGVSTFEDRLRNLQVEDVSLAPTVSQQARRFQMVKDLDRIQFPLTPGQRSNNAARRQLEAGLASNPITASPFADMAEQQSRVTGRLLAAGIGERGDAITPEVIDNAYVRLGGEFRDIAGELGPDVFEGADFAQFMNRLEGAKASEISDIRFAGEDFDSLPASRIINNMMDRAFEPVSGRELMAWRSSLVDEIQQLTSGRVTSARGSTVFSLSDAVDAIDELIVGASRGTEVAARYADARTQYRLLSAISKTRAIDQAGEIRPRTLANVLSNEYPLEYRRGRLTGFHPERSSSLQAVADAFDAVRGLSVIAPDIVANSGTPTRLFVQNLAMQDINPRGVASLALRASVGNSIADASLMVPSVGEGSRLVREAVPRTAAAVGASTAANEDIADEGVLDSLMNQ